MTASVLRISQYLDDNGDGTGSKNANGDYSLGVENFFYKATGYTDIHRVIVSIQDSGSFRANGYGAIFGAGAPSNGILVKVIDSDDLTELIDLTDNIGIKTNAQWGKLCYDVDVKAWGVGDEFLLARWTFTRGGSPLFLKPGQSLRFVLNDDFSGLVDHAFLIQGEIYP